MIDNSGVHDDRLIRPFLRWSGGKQRLVAYLNFVLPEKHPKRYFEPFLSGGSLFFANKFGQSELSDINPYLVNAYTQVKADPDQVHLQLAKHAFELQQIGKSYYYEQRHLFNIHKSDPAYLEEQAARFIFLNHSSFNGIYHVNSKGDYNVPIGRTLTPAMPSLEQLKAASAHLQSAKLYHRGYPEIVEYLRPGDMVFLDPPNPAFSPNANFAGVASNHLSLIEMHDLAACAHRMVARGAQVLIYTAKVDHIDRLFPNDQWSYNLIPMNRKITAKRPAIEVMEIVLVSR